MAGQVMSRASGDPLMEDDYESPSPRKGKASGKKSKQAPPKKGKGKSGKSGKRPPFAQAVPAQPSRIAQAMGGGPPC